MGGAPSVAPTDPVADPNNRLKSSAPDEPPLGMTPNQAAAPPPPPEPSTPLDQPIPAIWNRPAGQSIGGYLSDVWAHQNQGGVPAAIQEAKDTARVAADTWSIGQGDRVLSGQVTGPDLEAQRAQTDAAHARLTAISPGMDYAAQSLGYIVPGPMDLAAPFVGGAKLTQTAAPYVRQAIPTASKAAQDAIARVAAYSANSGLTTAAQDIGHGIYNVPQIIGDSAIGATIGGAVHGVNEAVAAGASKVKDWWNTPASGTPRPSGTPADITTANPTNPHAAKLEEWQNNMAVTGAPPSPTEVEAYGNQQFGADKSKWPAEYQNIYKSVQPRDQLGLIPRVAMGAGAFGLQYAAGLADSPMINYGVQAGLQGMGEFGSRLYRGDPVARADKSITGSYPALTGWNSTGNADPFAWRDALHKGLALPLAQAQPQ
jgi:hypothetical protein